MTFTAALHFPWMDVSRGWWIRDAILYWDRVHTIVPESVRDPYQSRTSRRLEDAGILVPVRIAPDAEEVQRSSREFLQYAETAPGRAILVGANRRHTAADPIDRLHPEKMSDELLRWFMLEGIVQGQDGAWLHVNRQVVNCYMTILAGNISYQRHLALLSDSQRYHNLAGMAQRGQTVDGAVAVSDAMREALLARMVLQVVTIDPRTSIEEIITFREQHAGEIARFRNEVGRLVSEMKAEYPSLDALSQSLHDTYISNVVPARKELEIRLSEGRIEHALKDLQSILLISGPSYLISEKLFEPVFMHHAGCIAVLATSAVTLGVQRVLYRIERERELRQNPYSFVLKAQLRFNRH